MLTVHYSLPLVWGSLWDRPALEQDDWYRQKSGRGIGDFEQTIETMLATSIPPGPMKRLRDLWPSLRLVEPFTGEDKQVWWNLSCTLKGPEEASSEEAKAMLEELVISKEGVKSRVVSPDQEAQALPFLKELKYVSLATLFEFYRVWSSYVDSLPISVIDMLRQDLFTLTMLVVLRALK